jgi:hypothetical protein
LQFAYRELGDDIKSRQAEIDFLTNAEGQMGFYSETLFPFCARDRVAVQTAGT